MSLDVTALISNLLPMLHTDTAANAIFTSDAELTDEFKDALKRLAEQYGCFVARDTSTVVFGDGQAIYAAPPLFLAPMHIAYNGFPLVATSTHELEARDDSYQTAAANAGSPIRKFYCDKIGAGQIGFYPVPSANDTGKSPEIIYLSYPCNLDHAHADTAIATPAVIGDYLEVKVLREAYFKESEFRCPEVAQACDGLAGLYEQALAAIQGPGQ